MSVAPQSRPSSGSGPSPRPAGITGALRPAADAASTADAVTDRQTSPDTGPLPDAREVRARADVLREGRGPSRGQGWLRRLARRLFVLDLLLVVVTLAVATAVRFGGSATRVSVAGAGGWEPLSSYAAVGVLLTVAWTTLLFAARTYDARVIGVGGEEYKRVVRSSVWLWGSVAIVCYVGRLEFARFYFAIAFPLGIVLLLLGRWTARKVLHRARRTSHAWSHRVLVVGAGTEAQDLVAELSREPYAGLHVVGACVPGGAGSEVTEIGSVPVVGSLDSVLQSVAATGADTVAVTASEGVTSAVLKRLGWELEGAGVDIVVAPALTDVAGPRVHVRPVSGLPLLYVEQPEFRGPAWVVKEVVDRAAAAIGLLLLSPVFGAAALLIRATSPGPVIFRQSRVGRDGNVFTVLKFRTMVVGAEAQLIDLRGINESDGALFKLRADPRVTRIGRVLRRFSVDELPQLVNVLTGSMSLVGPRPALPSEARQYGDTTARRLLVKPGITGLWQVSGRSDLSWEDSVRLDLYYVENWSLTGDVQILGKTVWAVLKGRGAY